jgi:hypothetical protein
LLWLACDVFIDAKMRLDVGFNAAQARLANLAHGGLLSRFPCREPGSGALAQQVGADHGGAP